MTFVVIAGPIINVGVTKKSYLINNEARREWPALEAAGADPEPARKLT